MADIFLYVPCHVLRVTQDVTFSFPIKFWLVDVTNFTENYIFNMAALKSNDSHAGYKISKIVRKHLHLCTMFVLGEKEKNVIPLTWTNKQSSSCTHNSHSPEGWHALWNSWNLTYTNCLLLLVLIHADKQ